MRISDWSSDVCSSALGLGIDVAIGAEANIAAGAIGAGKIGAGRNADVSIGLDQADRSVAAIGSDRGRSGRRDRSRDIDTAPVQRNRVAGGDVDSGDAVGRDDSVGAPRYGRSGIEKGRAWWWARMSVSGLISGVRVYVKPKKPN